MRVPLRIVGAAVLAAGLIGVGALSVLVPSSRAATEGTAKTAGGAKDYGPELRQLSKKLDEVLAAQKDLAGQIETQHAAVMEELRIVKVRTFQAGKPR